MEELIGQFVEALQRATVTWELAESPVTARLRLAGQLKEEGVAGVLSWDAGQLPVDGIVDALHVLGIKVITPSVRALPNHGDWRGEYPRRDLMADIESIETGITGAEAGIASTGTVVLRSGPGRPRVVGQLPRRHIVLLPLSRLYASPEQWLADRRAQGGAAALAEPACLSLISGPSLTADIELEIALGVHGPRLLHVILVEDTGRLGGTALQVARVESSSHRSRR